MKLYKKKPLEWDGMKSKCGRYEIDWIGDGKLALLWRTSIRQRWSSASPYGAPAEAKAAAEAHWQASDIPGIEEVEV